MRSAPAARLVARVGAALALSATLILSAGAGGSAGAGTGGPAPRLASDGPRAAASAPAAADPTDAASAEPSAAPSPAPSAAASEARAGDTRSSGQGPGFVGAPLLAILGVLAIGIGAAALTLGYVRMTGGSSAGSRTGRPSPDDGHPPGPG